jgi:hypothetical protein
MNMTKMLKKIRVFILGERAKGEYAYRKCNFITTYPLERPIFDEWCKELRVSCLHGKKIVHL